MDTLLYTEKQFWDAVYNDDKEEVLAILHAHPDLDVNVTSYLDTQELGRDDPTGGMVRIGSEHDDVFREAPIVSVCYYGDISMLKILIFLGADCNFMRSLPKNSCALQFAMWNDNALNMTRLLLDHGACASFITNAGETLLHEICTNIRVDHYQMATMLLSNMSTNEVYTVLGHRDNDGLTASEKAISVGFYFLAKIFDDELHKRKVEEHMLLLVGLPVLSNRSNSGAAVANLNHDALRCIIDAYNKQK
jgi:hypothetical protein